MGGSETPRVSGTRAVNGAIRERETELLVVGSGVAGCAAALAGARAGADVTLATKATQPEDSTSFWAQGGVAVARGDPEAFEDDVVAASDGLADPEAVDVLVSEADAAVRDVFVETLGVDFDGGSGSSDTELRSDARHGVEEPDYGREAAHGEARILHVDASTGKHVLAPFLQYLEDHERVEILEDTVALELLTHEGRVHGTVLERDGEWAPCFAGATVLATGGIGACYGRSTNPPSATGDGIAMAALAGADVEGLEYVQFHPTAFAGAGGPRDERVDEGRADDSEAADDHRRGTFLLSEAVRGEGALLRNADDERFMPGYHADAELAPRDVVARAVKSERERTGGVYLDVGPIDFEGSFPDLYAECLARDVDPADGIPVAPAEHFLCGGVDVDTEGRTSLDRLFAVGECAHTGVHGANRLASTSLLEALVWGLRAGEAAAGYDVRRVEPPELLDSDPELPDGFAAEKFVRLRRVMDEYVGIERTPADLRRGASVLRRLKGEVDAYTRTRTSRSLYELRGACVTALLVTRAAAENGESRGCHHLVEEATADAD